MTCSCGTETNQPITRHPVSGRKLDKPICRECAERIVREPCNAPGLREPSARRRMVKELGDV